MTGPHTIFRGPTLEEIGRALQSIGKKRDRTTSVMHLTIVTRTEETQDELQRGRKGICTIRRPAAGKGDLGSRREVLQGAKRQKKEKLVDPKYPEKDKNKRELADVLSLRDETGRYHQCKRNKIQLPCYPEGEGGSNRGEEEGGTPHLQSLFSIQIKWWETVREM